MLRAKQLTTLTQCARSFYLTGSRTSTADGAPSTCSDDHESCISNPKSQSKPKSTVYVDPTNPNFTTPESNNKPLIPYSVGPSEPQIVNKNNNNGANKYNAAKYYIKPSVPTIFKAVPVPVQVPQETGTADSSSSSSTNSSYNNNYNNKSSSSSKLTQNKPNIPKNETHSKSGANNNNNNITNNTNQNFVKSPPVNSPKPTNRGSKIPSSSSPVQPSYQNPPHKTPNYTNRSSYNNSRSTKSKTFHNHRSTVDQVRAVEQYYHTLQQLKWGPLAERALDSLQSRLDAFQANQVLKLLNRDSSAALGFFKWLKRQPGFKHDCHTYTTMIGILGQAKQLGQMRKLLEEMVADSCQPSVVTYNRLIHAYGKANYINEAVRVFEEMRRVGIEPDKVTYCTLIDIHAKAGFLETAMDLYSRIKESGISIDTFTYSVMVNCLGKAGQLAAAYRLFNEMVENGCTPNIVTYNTMIALQAKARNYDSVVKLYKDMQNAGFKPDKITYSIVIEVLGQNGRLEETEQVFTQMEKDWIPDEPVFGLLVDLWGKSGNVDKAKFWYNSMLKAGLRPNVPTCNSLLSAFLRAERFNDAYFVLQNMLHVGLVPSLQTYTLLLSNCKETCFNKGLYCRLMEITKHPAHSFLFYLPSAEPGGNNIKNHANYFLDLMHSEDRESKRGLIDAVIDFLHQSGFKEEAGFIWEIAAQKNIYPDSLKEKRDSYWLINLHLMSEGTALIALSRTLAWFHRRIRVLGFGVERIDIVTGWGRRSRITGASLVKKSVENLLCLFEFPFFTVSNNSGCFVGSGERLNDWLGNSFVERMHLL
ncbi:hypothetical protein LUZ60_005265 [Juncus effusus]|nr:hypothetical protein LUZ60_005265 [Juncus effusus]